MVMPSAQSRSDVKVLLTLPSVWSAAASPDGRWLATGSAENAVRVHDVATAECSAVVLRGHTGGVRCLTFGVVWQDRFRYNRAKHAGSHNPVRQLLASGSEDTTLRIWDVTKKRHKCRAVLLGHTRWVTGVAFAPAGDILASSSDDTCVRLWDTTEWYATRVLQGHTGIVCGLAFAPQALGGQPASVSSDRTVRLWRIRNRTRAGILHSNDKLTSIAFSPLPLALLPSAPKKEAPRTSSNNNNNNTAQSRRRRSSSHGAVAHAGHARRNSSGRNRSRSHGQAGPSSDFNFVHSLVAAAPPTTSSSATTPASARQPRPPMYLMATGSEDGAVRLWEMCGGPVRRPVRELLGHTSAVSSLDFSADGTRLVSGSHDATVRVWNVTTGVLLHFLRGHTKAVNRVLFAPALTVSSTPRKLTRSETMPQTTATKTGTGSGTATPTSSAAASPARSNSSSSGSNHNGMSAAESSEASPGSVTTTSTGATIIDLDSTAGPMVAPVTCTPAKPGSDDGQRVVSVSTDGTIRTWLLLKWNDRTHRFFSVEFRATVFYLMCVRQRLDHGLHWGWRDAHKMAWIFARNHLSPPVRRRTAALPVCNGSTANTNNRSTSGHNRDSRRENNTGSRNNRSASTTPTSSRRGSIDTPRLPSVQQVQPSSTARHPLKQRNNQKNSGSGSKSISRSESMPCKAASKPQPGTSMQLPYLPMEMWLEIFSFLQKVM
eukprot:m.90631 g.90631  ORF g.90631 m.90631 type:complete len:715 (-) comp15273_c0_seq3:1089-3233(-)